jgi:bla regulator protein blaR1
MNSTTSIYILNHLWQSTLFAGFAGLLTLLLRRNGARARYWLWLAASVKFLIPFMLLVTAGSYFDLGSKAPNAPAVVAFEQVFEAPTLNLTAPPAIPPQTPSRVPSLLLVTWLCGFLTVLIRWSRQWRRIRAAVHAATPLDFALPMRVLSSSTLLEPGVFGVVRPVLLLPQGIGERLTPKQMLAVVAHELCHVRCHDNLCAAIQMLVEAAFWFHPLVWWIGKRMVDERERACDEEVLRQGSDPQLYAESILKVCTLYLESPLACVAGVTGSNLRKRIRGIMTNRMAQKLDRPRKLIIAISGIAALATPIVFGILNPLAIRAQSAKTFDVTSVKAASPKNRPDVRVSPTGIDYTAYSVRALIADAYNFRLASISSPDGRTKDLINGAFFDISAKTDHPVSRAELNQMLQSLLRDRFKLTLHHESRTESVYTLTTAASGLKLRESASDGPLESRIRPDGGVNCKNTTMQIFSEFLTARLSRVVLDETSLKGQYDFELKLDGLPSINQLQEAAASGNMEAAGAMKRKMVDWTESSIFSDIQKQLGLKLESGRASVDNLVIDHAEKPTEN